MRKLKWLPVLWILGVLALGALLGGLMAEAQVAKPAPVAVPKTAAAVPAAKASKPEAKLSPEQAAKVWASFSRVQQIQAQVAQTQVKLNDLEKQEAQQSAAHNALLVAVQAEAKCSALKPQADDTIVCVPEPEKKPEAKAGAK